MAKAKTGLGPRASGLGQKKTDAKPGAAKSTKAAEPVTVAKKPARPTKPSLPLPPPPPPPPATRVELEAPRDIGRLLRYGEKFGPTNKIDVRMLPLALPIAGTQIGICDPGAAKSFKAFDRPTSHGQFRVMLSIAKTEGKPDRLAAAIIHVGRPAPVMKWTVAHYAGGKAPKSADALPRLASASGMVALVDAGGGAPGAFAVTPPANGIDPVVVQLADGRTALAFASGADDAGFAAYWAVDANDKPVCLAIDFETFLQKDWKAKN